MRLYLCVLKNGRRAQVRTMREQWGLDEPLSCFWHIGHGELCGWYVKEVVDAEDSGNADDPI